MGGAFYLSRPSGNFDGEPGLSLSCYIKELPCLIEWKMNGEGACVVGIEPAKAFVSGRDAGRESGRLQLPGPGGKRRYRLEPGVLENNRETAQIKESIRALR